ncbi:MAG: hypothetical protein AAGK21_18400 [Bacteroidota bacterium]
MRFLSLLVLLAFVAAPASFAQSTVAAADWPEANPAEVATTDAIVDALYEVISGPSDVDRDWDRFRSLMHPEGRLIPIAQRPDGTSAPVVYSADEYAEVAGQIFRESPMFQGKGFYEVEATRRVERYGTIAHVWSTYESRFDPSEEEPFSRGINSIQLVWDGSRWHVLSITWHQETEGTPIPAPYLPEG